MKNTLKVIKDNVPSLRKKSLPISLPLSSEDKEFAFALLSFLKNTRDKDFRAKNKVREGVGLAAPQLGHNIRIIAISYLDNVDDKEELVEYLLVNPIITSQSVKLCYLRCGEGCLSVDKEYQGYVHRPYKITIKAYNVLTEKEEEITVKGFKSIVFQHEIDHLNGVLFYDRIDKNNPFKELPNSIEI